ncbi:MAG: DUF3298 domain-containing protein [Bacteroidota bacterium]
MRCFLFLLAVTVLLTQCQSDSTTADDMTITAAATDTLTYSIERLSQQEPNCIGDTCAKIQINFVQFQSGGDSLAIRQMNQNILNSFRGNEYTNVIAYINGFIQDYMQGRQEFPDMPKWEEENSQRVVFNSPTLVGLVTSNYAFRGGAHPSYATIFDNYDPETGNAISWKDLLQAGQEEKMTELGEDYFREAYELASHEALVDSEFQFKDGQFYLPDNFIFNQAGITFLYTLYEIGPYAAGEHEFTIPYKEVRSLLRERYAALLQ